MLLKAHVVAPVFVLVAGSAFAAAPTQLRNKTIAVSMSVQIVQRTADGRMSTPQLQSQWTIYVSNAGRAFARLTRRIDGSHSAVRTDDVAPGKNPAVNSETRELKFEEGRLVSYVAYASGAARMVISFNQGYSNCNADLLFARAGGAPIKVRGLNGVMYETQSMTVSRQTCTIRDGNPFAK